VAAGYVVRTNAEHTIFATRTRTEPVAWDLVPARPPPLPPVRLL